MRRDRLSQDTERDVVPDACQPRSDERGAHLGGWPMTKPFPFLLTPADLQQVFQIAASTYFNHLAAFERFAAPSVGIGNRRYLGSKVKAFFESGASTRTFGGKRGPRVVKVVPMHGSTVATDPAGEKSHSLALSSVGNPTKAGAR